MANQWEGGWKLHLAVSDDPNDPLSSGISAWLKDKGVHHKIGHGGTTEEGKGMTIYVGGHDETTRLANELSTKFQLPAARGEALANERQFAPGVVGRFAPQFDDRFHQYGSHGLSHLKEDVGQSLFGGGGLKRSKEEMARRAENVIVNDPKLGPLYGPRQFGSTLNPKFGANIYVMPNVTAGDSKVVQAMQERLGTLQESFPEVAKRVKNVWFDATTTPIPSGFGGVTTPTSNARPWESRGSEQGIVFNVKSIPEVAPGRHIGGGAEDTVTHEFGHMLHGHLWDQEHSGMDKPLPGMPFELPKALKEHLEETLGTSDPVKLGKIIGSSYGGTNEVEVFAEMFTQWQRGEARPEIAEGMEKVAGQAQIPISSFVEEVVPEIKPTPEKVATPAAEEVVAKETKRAEEVVIDTTRPETAKEEEQVVVGGFEKVGEMWGKLSGKGKLGVAVGGTILAANLISRHSIRHHQNVPHGLDNARPAYVQMNGQGYDDPRNQEQMSAFNMDTPPYLSRPNSSKGARKGQMDYRRSVLGLV